ncbi:cation diffusion facilitator family transporter [Sabulicella rubraurantiaca]|uniref:cation diffusion facilitator family transporter n=1 Tax=Sabulicella rubraurantiaca TaxID=2811429 RepID=UPI001A959069|nr:cation diffusion facilitator family transporter [Sabulicella rubraurantiaca]
MSVTVTPAERSRERSLLFALLADASILVVFTTVGVLSGSLSVLAETLRGALLMVLGWYSLYVMRQVHRAALHDYDYGTGKVEQFANFLVALGLLIGAAWLLFRGISNLVSPPPRSSGLLLMGGVVSAVNVVLNSVAFLALWRSGRDGASVVMRGQIRSRLGKLIVSVLVTVAILVAAFVSDPAVARHADVAGGFLVVAVMVVIAAGLFRQTVPDLLDRTLAEARQAAINRVLSRFFDRYDALGSIRSRQSGGRVHVEVTLGFRGDLPFAEVAATSREIAAAVEEEMPGAEVVVRPVQHPALA